MGGVGVFQLTFVLCCIFFSKGRTKLQTIPLDSLSQDEAIAHLCGLTGILFRMLCGWRLADIRAEWAAPCVDTTQYVS